MRSFLISLVATFVFVGFLSGQASHLLLLNQGDGAVTSAVGSSAEKLTKATFLPKDQIISVRPRSGIETLASGFQFRFGAGTRFSVSEQGIELNEGSAMIRSRKINNSANIAGPESSVRLNGSGCFLVEVGTNGGLKVITILGRLNLIDLKAELSFELLPGELVFVMPGGRGFAEKVNVNLQKLIESSYLVSGFPNNTSFKNSLDSVAAAQAESIGVTYGAEVGDAKSADSFEVVPTQNRKTGNTAVNKANEGNSQVGQGGTYKSPSSDPLVELLGRFPKRMESEASGQKVESEEKAQNSPSNGTESSNRPFPSRLLRKK